MDIDQILDRLKKVRGTGANKWVACCPAHDDQTSSLAITLSEPGDKLFLKCWFGAARFVCEFAIITRQSAADIASSII